MSNKEIADIFAEMAQIPEIDETDNEGFKTRRIGESRSPYPRAA